MAGSPFYIPIVGEKFGNWTVISETEGPRSRHQRTWLCRCGCGREKFVLVTALVTGRSTNCRSCGVKRRWDRDRVFVPGKRYGRITLLEQATWGTNSRWRVQCDCGRVYESFVNRLSDRERPGRHPSCRDCARESRAVGRRFGAVVRTEEDRKRYRLWRRLSNEGVLGAEWSNDFAVFSAGVGDPPDGRFPVRPDRSRPMGPDNFQWAPFAENKRNVLLTYRGITAPRAHWAQWFGVSHQLLEQRLQQTNGVLFAWLLRPAHSVVQVGRTRWPTSYTCGRCGRQGHNRRACLTIITGRKPPEIGT